jgi:hypothetical protein
MSQELTAPNKVGIDPITTALVAAGVTSASIEQLAKDYGELAQLAEVTTEEEYEQVHRAQLAHRDIRVAVVAALKSEREEAVRYQKLVVSEEKRIVSLIERTEAPLKKLKDDWNHKEELKIQEAARLWAERMNLRKQAAFDIGYYYNGQHYLLDRENGEAPWVLNEDQIAGMAMSDEALYTLLDAQAAELKLTREIKAEAEARAEEERLAKEAAAKAEADRIAAAQEELERKQKEMEEKERQMNARVLKSRTDAIQAVGGAVHGDGGWGWLEFRKPASEVLAMSEEGFSAFVSEIKDRRIEWDTDQELQRQKQEQERIAREEQMRAEAEERGRQAEAARQAQAKADEEKEKALLAQQEADRIASIGDKGLVEQLSAHLACAPVPDLRTAIGKHGMARVRKHLVELINMVNAIAKDL